jgi:hypothetical protein
LLSRAWKAFTKLKEKNDKVNTHLTGSQRIHGR